MTTATPPFAPTAPGLTLVSATRLTDDVQLVPAYVPGGSQTDTVIDADALAPVDLNALGYGKAEDHRGNAHALDNLLNRVLRGYLVDEGNDGERRQRHERQTDEKILALQKQAEEARTQIRTINDADLPALHDQLTDLDAEMLHIRREEAAGLRQLANPNQWPCYVTF